MDNKEIIAKIDEILKTKNFLDMYDEMLTFEKEYIKTPFYKKHKIKLLELVKTYKQFDILNFEKMFKILQTGVDGLDLSNLTNILEQFANMVAKDSGELKETISKFKEIFEAEVQLNDKK
jgi:hypothetical protein